MGFPKILQVLKSKTSFSGHSFIGPWPRTHEPPSSVVHIFVCLKNLLALQKIGQKLLIFDQAGDLKSDIPTFTLLQTNIAMEISMFRGKSHQNGGFSMAMLVSGRVVLSFQPPQGGTGAKLPTWQGSTGLGL